MYQISVRDSFCAAHSIRISGAQEPVHGHNWRVTAIIEGPDLDDDGLVCDFHTVEATLAAILDPFRNNDLNRIPPFNAISPTAELIARYIADELADRLDKALAPYGSRVSSVGVTEAEGCEAFYLPPSETRS